MSELHFPWLECSLIVPLLGALWTRLAIDSRSARLRALVTTAVTLLLTLGEWRDFVSLHTFEAHDRWDAFAWLMHWDVLVVDELSAPLIPMLAGLFFLIVLATLSHKRDRFSFGSTLIQESILIALFSCRDPWVVIALMSLCLALPYRDLLRRGQRTRIFRLHAWLFVGFLVAGQMLVDLASEGSATTTVGLALIAVAIMIRSGVAPFHLWMPDLFAKASFGTSLLTVLPMAGAYGAMRLILPFAPDELLRLIGLASLVTAIYAAGMTLVQTRARQAFCYLFLSFSSLVLVGLETDTPIGLTGGLSVWLAVGLAMGGFGLTLRSVEHRVGRIDLRRFHGLYEQMPHLAVFFLITGLASIGFPGTVGFIALEMLIDGAVQVSPAAGFGAVVVTALNSVAVMWMFFRVFTGRRTHAMVELSARKPEKVAVLVLSTILLLGGLWPQPGVHSRYHAASVLLQTRIDRGLHDPQSHGATLRNEHASIGSTGHFTATANH